jgi:hypothetical protein
MAGRISSDPAGRCQARPRNEHDSFADPRSVVPLPKHPVVSWIYAKPPKRLVAAFGREIATMAWFDYGACFFRIIGNCSIAAPSAVSSSVDWPQLASSGASFSDAVFIRGPKVVPNHSPAD